MMRDVIGFAGEVRAIIRDTISEKRDALASKLARLETDAEIKGQIIGLQLAIEIINEEMDNL